MNPPPPLYRCQKCEYAFRFPSRETARVPRMFGGGAVATCPRCYKEALRGVGMAVPAAVTRAGAAAGGNRYVTPDTLSLDDACARAYRVNYYD